MYREGWIIKENWKNDMRSVIDKNKILEKVQNARFERK
jgi:hypothetical protein